MGIVGENVQAEGIANVKLDGGIGQCGWGGGLLSEGKNGKNEIRGVLGVRAIVRALDSAPNEMWNHWRAWNRRGLLSDFWFKWVTFTQMVVSRMGYIDSQSVGLLYSILIFFNVAFEREGDFF